jgi:hypothetical protein
VPGTDGPAAAIALAVSLRGDRVLALLEPLRPLFAADGRTGDGGAETLAEIDRVARLWDGTLRFSSGGPEQTLLAGTAEVARCRALLADPEVLDRRRRAAARARRDVEYEPAALVHRGVPLLRIGAADRSDGQETWCGAAADCMFALGGRDADAVRRFVDGIRDRPAGGAPPREPLGDGVVARMDLDIARLRGKLPSGEAGGGALRSLRLCVAAPGGAVTLRLELR